jgi:hypothetical protein
LISFASLSLFFRAIDDRSLVSPPDRLIIGCSPSLLPRLLAARQSSQGPIGCKLRRAACTQNWPPFGRRQSRFFEG